jgi:type IV secretion system protein VirD4
MTVYLCLSAPKFPTFNRWLRLVLTSALDEMTDTLDPPPLPVCFMLDELATLGHLAAVENAVGLAAGYGIQLVTVFQDTAQMKDLYKGRWASFIGNAGVRALFNLDDYDTAEYWSTFASGKMLVLAQGAHPIVTDRVPYWKDNGLSGLWDDPRATGTGAPGAKSAPAPAAPMPDPWAET